MGASRAEAERAFALLAQKDKQCYEASERGDYDQVCSLLECGAAPEAYISDRSGFVSLLAAARWGHFRIVQRLLDHPDVHIDYQSDRCDEQVLRKNANALMLASLYGHTKVVEVLLAKKAKVDLQSSNKNTALNVASIRGNTDIVQQLIAAGATVDLKGEGGAPALMKACYNGHFKIAELLITHGANMNIRSNSCELALRWAQKQGHKDIQALLLSHGAGTAVSAFVGKRPSAPEDSYKNPFSRASSSKFVDAETEKKMRQIASLMQYCVALAPENRDLFTRTTSAPLDKILPNTSMAKKMKLLGSKVIVNNLTANLRQKLVPKLNAQGGDSQNKNPTYDVDRLRAQKDLFCRTLSDPGPQRPLKQVYTQAANPQHSIVGFSTCSSDVLRLPTVPKDKTRATSDDFSRTPSADSNASTVTG